MDLQSALETSSKELELAKIKLDKRDKMMKEKDETIKELQKNLDIKNGKKKTLLTLPTMIQGSKQGLVNAHCPVIGQIDFWVYFCSMCVF